MSLQIAREVSKSKIKLTCNLCAKLFEKDIKCIWQIWHVAKFQISLEMVATKKVFAPFKSVLVMQSCPILCDPMDCSPPGSSVHGISQVRILEGGAISFSRGSSQPRDWTQLSPIAGRLFYWLSQSGNTSFRENTLKWISVHVQLYNYPVNTVIEMLIESKIALIMTTQGPMKVISYVWIF